jgi:hypothetical protein
MWQDPPLHKNRCTRTVAQEMPRQADSHPALTRSGSSLEQCVALALKALALKALALKALALKALAVKALAHAGVQ